MPVEQGFTRRAPPGRSKVTYQSVDAYPATFRVASTTTPLRFVDFPCDREPTSDPAPDDPRRRPRTSRASRIASRSSAAASPGCTRRATSASTPRSGSRSSTGATSTCSSRCSTRSRPARCRPATSPSRSARSSASSATRRSSSARPSASTSRRARSCLSDGGPIDYDTLIVATGAHHTYFDHPEWATLAPGLKTIEDATEIRRGSSSRSRPPNARPTRTGGASG